jgi:transketolase
MGSIMNGMTLHGGVRPFAGTFLIFSDYMRPAIRLAGLMGQPPVYVFSHDSIGLGEDGPTHQPIEQLSSLRAIPNVMDLRPGDGPETEVAWRVAIERTDGPSFLALSRQKVSVLTREGSAAAAEDSAAERLAAADGLRRGAYVIAEASQGTPRVILMSSGSELSLALDARSELEADGIPTRVVSMPSWYLFGLQDTAYRDEILPPSVKARVSVEAGSTFGWDRWVGSEGHSIGVDHFGASAPAEVLYEKFGITSEAVVASARDLVADS